MFQTLHITSYLVNVLQATCAKSQVLYIYLTYLSNMARQYKRLSCLIQMYGFCKLVELGRELFVINVAITSSVYIAHRERSNIKEPYDLQMSGFFIIVALMTQNCSACHAGW